MPAGDTKVRKEVTKSNNADGKKKKKLKIKEFNKRWKVGGRADFD